MLFAGVNKRKMGVNQHQTNGVLNGTSAKTENKKNGDFSLKSSYKSPNYIAVRKNKKFLKHINDDLEKRVQRVGLRSG